MHLKYLQLLNLLIPFTIATPAASHFNKRDSGSGSAGASKNATATALRLERATWATGPVANDTFYAAPQNSTTAQPGSLLKLQANVNSTLFALPPGQSLARILYQTATMNGTSVPASAYILLPFAAKSYVDGAPIVVFAHGTSGLYAECAPSHMTSLFQHYLAPYALAQAGYVVVGIDYAGLGVSHTANGNFITHEYSSNIASANDAIYAAQAAHTAFPTRLSKRFVVMGHSEGGGTAWAAAQRQALTPVDGYLSAVAVAPVTRLSDEAEGAGYLTISAFIS